MKYNSIRRPSFRMASLQAKYCAMYIPFLHCMAKKERRRLRIKSYYRGKVKRRR